MLKLLGWLFGVGFIAFCGIAAGAGYILWQTQQDLPDYRQLAQYEPPVMTRVHAGDGSLLAEYARQRRLFLPLDVIPQKLIDAFISAEDKGFYQHSGLDWPGVGRAVIVNIQNVVNGGGRKLVGASTITQQVAKNFLLTNEQTWKRKLKEALLALRIEQSFSKQQILELYLNEIFLGLNSYGVAAASLNYYGRPLNELTIDEMAYLAALPKGPNNYHPYKQHEKALERRNWVLSRMADNGYITRSEEEKYKKMPLNVTPRQAATRFFAAESFAEEVRREVLQLYGEEKLYSGGLSIRTTLDPTMQSKARQALTRGLLKFDRKQGFRGPVTRIDAGSDWEGALLRLPFAADLRGWALAVVLDTTGKEAKIGLRPEPSDDGRSVRKQLTGVIPLELMTWARKTEVNADGQSEIASPAVVLSVGDVIYVAPTKDKNQYHLVQLPEIEGGLVAMDPHTGRVLALVG
ncbi:MAG: transglycosylase domain-containing protein, partial [Pseudomonadota bacterium]|nr:transglycosylase domain-containing protein [Pseudomonadota bacterium]